VEKSLKRERERERERESCGGCARVEMMVVVVSGVLE
jgi:hypothetical protein